MRVTDAIPVLGRDLVWEFGHPMPREKSFRTNVLRAKVTKSLKVKDWIVIKPCRNVEYWGFFVDEGEIASLYRAMIFQELSKTSV